MHAETGLPSSPTTQTEPADFDEFWEGTIASARSYDLDAAIRPVPTRLTTLDVYDLSFRGYGGDRVRAWLRTPRFLVGRLPGLVQFTGYGNGRGHALRDLRWASAGYAHLVVDARGQGHGDTDDDYSGGPSSGGYLTRGIRSAHEYYYRRVYTDAVRAVEALRALPLVDPLRVGAVGASQGGGIALALAGLVTDLAAVVVQAPALCELNRAAELSDQVPYSLLADHFASRRLEVPAALDTLRYFDGVNHAKRAQAPALLSTGLADRITPPATVLPAFQAYAGPKRVTLWRYNGHEAGGDLDEENALAFAGALLRPTPEPTTTPDSGADDGARHTQVRNS